MSADARSRLCPEHRSDSNPTSSCVACAQAHRITDLEQTIEQLTKHVAALETDENDNSFRYFRASDLKEIDPELSGKLVDTVGQRYVTINWQ